MRRSWFAVAMALAVVVTGCAGATSTSAPTITLDFPSFQATQAGYADWWKELIKEFESQHPNAKINFTEVPYPDFHDTMASRFVAKNPPDILQLAPEGIVKFASQGWLEPLDERLAGTDIPKTWMPFQKEMVWQGKTIGVLHLTWAILLYYNENLLKQANVAVPTTPDELITAIQALAKYYQGKDIFAMGLSTSPADESLYTTATMFPAGFGLHWADQTGWQLTNPKVVDIVDKYYRKAVSYSPSGSDTIRIDQMFEQGKVAMLFEGPWLNGEIAVAAAPDVKPYLKAAPPPFTTFFGGAGPSIHIPSSISAERKDLVWEFIKLSAEPKWQARYAILSGTPPGRMDAVPASELDQYPLLKVSLDVAQKTTVPEYPAVDWVRMNGPEFRKRMQDMLFELQSTNRPTADIMADAEKKMVDAGIAPPQ